MLSLIPSVHNENGDKEICGDDNDITIEEKGVQIIWKGGMMLTFRTCCLLLLIT